MPRAREPKTPKKQKPRQKQRQKQMQSVNVRVGGGGGGGDEGYKRPQIVQVQDRYEPIGGSYAPPTANDMIAAHVEGQRAAVRERQKMNDRAYVQNMVARGVQGAIAVAPHALSLWRGFRAPAHAAARAPPDLGTPNASLGRGAPSGSGPSNAPPENGASSGLAPGHGAAPFGGPPPRDIFGVGGLGENTPERRWMEMGRRLAATRDADNARRREERAARREYGGKERGGPSGTRS